jgi:nucleoside-diphosphate kinase
MNQKTLCLLKPDICRRHLVGKALIILEENFKINKLEMQSLSEEKIEKFYEEHKDKVFFPQLVKFMMAGPVVALELEGEDAISRLRKLMGHFNPNMAEEDTLRKQFGISMDENSFHGSDSEKSSRREIAIIFEGK